MQLSHCFAAPGGPRHTRPWRPRTRCRSVPPRGYQKGRSPACPSPKDELAGRMTDGMWAKVCGIKQSCGPGVGFSYCCCFLPPQIPVNQHLLEVGCASKLLIPYIRLLHNYIFCQRSRLLHVNPTLINYMLLILFRMSNLAVLTSL